MLRQALLGFYFMHAGGIKRNLQAISLFLLIMLVTSCSTQPDAVRSTDISFNTGLKIAIVNHGWHTGIVIPASSISVRFPQLKARFATAPYIEFGWGDKAFYQASEITIGLLLQAIFWPSESVIHAAAIPDSPEEYFINSKIKTLCLNNIQSAKLIQFIENSFYKNAKSEIFPLESGLYGDSQFYKAEGNYYLANTCNKWTAKALRSAEMDISTTFKLTADSVMRYLNTPDISHKKTIESCRD